MAASRSLSIPLSPSFFFLLAPVHPNRWVGVNRLLLTGHTRLSWGLETGSYCTICGLKTGGREVTAHFTAVIYPVSANLCFSHSKIFCNKTGWKWLLVSFVYFSFVRKRQKNIWFVLYPSRAATVATRSCWLCVLLTTKPLWYGQDYI